MWFITLYFMGLGELLEGRFLSWLRNYEAYGNQVYILTG